MENSEAQDNFNYTNIRCVTTAKCVPFQGTAALDKPEIALGGMLNKAT